jgi:hypothetical protein
MSRDGGEQARSEVDLWLAAGSGEMGKMERRHQGVRPWQRGGGSRRGLGLVHGDAHSRAGEIEEGVAGEEERGGDWRRGRMR